MPRSSRSPASRSPRRRCASATHKAPNVSAGRSARSRRARCATRPVLLVGWGMGTATFPALMFQAEARAVMRSDGTGVMETGAHDMGQGAWTALRPDRGRRAGARPRPGRIQVRHVGPAGCRHRRRLGAHRDRRHGDPQCRRCRHRQTRRSRHRRRALAAVRRRQCRRGRARRPPVPPRRRDPQRKLCRYPWRAPDSPRSKHRATAPPIPRRNRTTPCTRMAPSSPRSRSIRISVRSASPAWSAPSPPAGSSIRAWCAASCSAA